MRNASEQISIVLVEPQGPANVGMVCRAMKNMGLSNLRLVNPCSLEHPDALKYAVSAKDILEKAEIFPSLEAAIADSPISVATTRRHGKYRQEIMTPSEVVKEAEGLLSGNRAAFVFGREDSGLTTEEVSICRWLSTIDTSQEYGSLNLAQAVLIFCYEIFNGIKAENCKESRILASGEEIESMFGQMEKTLLRIGFLNKENPDHIMRSLRRVLARAELDLREVSIFRGMMSQIDWATSDFRGKKGKS